ncbi:legumain isoform X1 [Hydra vulgaris]|uniref:legumain isoform X1 n=1 Tax=Hydra vulgaris TaxID=6087 RepID=UPI001F5EF6B6|nr:legumain-like [Hydra vulgaris]
MCQVEMRFAISFVFLALMLCASESKHWALIVAGSNGWYNYRHQADVCHAYQILHKHGIPDENIVVMMYDDIANNEANPTPGVIINKPGGGDVYKGVPKDYIGEDVTPANFLKVLKGDKNGLKGVGSGKVIDSGPNDNVFVFFADHGAPNIIAFPTDELHAKDLNAAIQYMHTNKKYRQMVIYIEACESGSMFINKLQNNISVFATTAANGVESSYACYYDDARQTYLGDVYSVKWMENSDNANFLVETLEDQFKDVQEETNTSHVMQFGDMNVSKMTLGLFQGNGNSFIPKNEYSKKSIITDAVPSHDVVPSILSRIASEGSTPEIRNVAQKALNEVNQKRIECWTVIRKIVSELVSASKEEEVLTKPGKPIYEECYKQSVTKFREYCFNFNEYEHALRHVYVLANLCDERIPTEKITRVIKTVCQKRKLA